MKPTPEDTQHATTTKRGPRPFDAGHMIDHETKSGTRPNAFRLGNRDCHDTKTGRGPNTHIGVGIVIYPEATTERSPNISTLPSWCITKPKPKEAQKHSDLGIVIYHETNAERRPNTKPIHNEPNAFQLYTRDFSRGHTRKETPHISTWEP